MKRRITCALIFLFACDNISAQVPDWTWAKSATGTLHDTALAITKDTSGNIYVTGSYASPSITFGSITLTNHSGGNTDVFVVKYDTSGNVVWAKSGGGWSNDNGKDICLDAWGNVYVTGICEGWGPIAFDIVSGSAQSGASSISSFIVKYNSSGNAIWIRVICGSDPVKSYGVTSDSISGVYLTGDFKEGDQLIDNILQTVMPLNSWGNGRNIFIIKYDSSGTWIWSKGTGSSNHNDYGFGITYNASGYIYVTGNFSGDSASFGTLTLYNSGAASTSEIYLVKYNLLGSALWARKAGGSSNDGANRVTTDGSGNIFITGFFSSSSFNYGSSVLTNSGGDDIFIAKYDATGNVLWANRAGGINNETGLSIATDVNGNPHITGRYTSLTIVFGSTSLANTNGLEDIFVMKYNSAGNELWGKSAGGSDNDFGYGIIINSFGKPCIAGGFMSSSITFGSTTLINTGYSDALVAQLDFEELGVPVQNIYSYNEVNIFPNPATNQLTIENGQMKINSVEIWDVMGRRCFALLLNSLKGTSASIDVSGLVSGIYFVKVRGENEESVLKFVKQ